MRLFITILLLLAASRTMAQLSPSTYREEVIAYSLDIESSQNLVEQAVENLRYVKRSKLPNLSAAGRYTHTLRNLNNYKKWALNLEPQIIQTIYGGGAVRANIDKAELNEQIATHNAEYTLLEVCYAADYAYWNLWAMNRLHLAMEQYVEIINEELRVIRRRFEEGYIPKGDLLMIESRLSEAEYSLISTNKSRVVARNNLNILRGIEPKHTVKQIAQPVDTLNTPQRVPIDLAIEQRPDYISSILSEESAIASTRAIRGAYNPQIRGGVGGSWRSYLPNTNGDTYLDGSAFVELSIPIFHFGERRKAVAISKATERQTQITTSMLRDAITKEESNAWAAVRESREHLSVASRSLRLASENLQISTYSYNEGEVSIVELMQAQISWIQIYNNSIESEYNYRLALAYYRRTVGGW